jgi:hypothetical protein
MESSVSSCLSRLFLPLLLTVGKEGRRGLSFCWVFDSGGGDWEVLVEADGAERRTERRVSLDESGGPIAADWAMGERDDVGISGLSVQSELNRFTLHLYML